MNNFTAVGFDFGGVVGSKKHVMPGIAEITGVPLEQLRAAYFQNNKLANVDGMPYEKVWEIVIGQLNAMTKWQEVLAYLNENMTVELNSEVLKIAADLKTRGLKVGLFSNNTKANGEQLRAQGLEKYFDPFVISAEIGYQKPDPKAFQIFFEKMQVAPKRAIYIDDTEQSLSTVGEIGYYPILFKDAAQLRADLEPLGLLN